MKLIVCSEKQIYFESKSLAPNLDNPQELENVIKQTVDMSKLTEEIIEADKLIKLNINRFLVGQVL